MGAIRTLTEKRTQSAGMALGGLGTGTVEIHPNGQLNNWQIFNRGKWAAVDPDQCGLQDLLGSENDLLSFYIRSQAKGKSPVVRKLSHGGAGNFRSVMYSWMKEVQEISWTPEFPVCNMEYADNALSVQVRAEFASPFLPHDSKISGTPGFYGNFHLINPTDQELEVSLMGILRNPINQGAKQRKLQNRITTEPNRTALTMCSDSRECLPQNGSLSFSVSGGESSYIQGDFDSFFGAFVLKGPFGITEESCLFDFMEKGRLPNSGWKHKDDILLSLTEEAIDKMDSVQLECLVQKLCILPSAEQAWSRISQVSPKIVSDNSGKRKFAEMMLQQYKKAEGKTVGMDWGSGALCSRVTLKPGESRDMLFTVGWHFPYHYSANRSFLGHQYSNWFQNSMEVCDFLCKNADEILPETIAFSHLLQESDVAPSFIRNWTVQLNTLLKSSWWLANNKFGIWEGYGSCGFHTTDITYHGSFGLLALFPDLQLQQMEMTASFQKADGRIPHLFLSDFSTVDNGFERIDLNPQFVLLVCRDYLWTGDRHYLQRMWSHVIRAMESTECLDENEDALPDQDTALNTYDAWKFQGTSTYIAGLWLASLSAAIRMAEDMKDSIHRAHWETLLSTGKKNFIEKLWNGNYFGLWIDGNERDECCMSNQLDGIWYARLIGLPPILDDYYILQSVQTILRYNFHTETGLVNAEYPPETTPTLYTYHNVQADANWSGIEFGFASFLLELGLVPEAEKLSDIVEERYFQAGRIFNHEECGEYYYRALSSWTMLLSLTGFKPNMPAGVLTVRPAMEKITAPWSAPTGYGCICQTKKKFELECLHGELTFQELRA